MIATLRRMEGVVSVDLVGEEKIELDLRVVNRVTADDFVQVVPLAHDLGIIRHKGENLSIEKGFKGLNYLFLAHCYK